MEVSPSETGTPAEAKEKHSSYLKPYGSEEVLEGYYGQVDMRTKCIAGYETIMWLTPHHRMDENWIEQLI